MKTGAVVVNFNAGQTIERCIASLRSEPSISSVVVIDNASTDGSENLIPSDVLVRNQSNTGFSKAVNQGVAMLDHRCQRILLMNPDAWLTEGSLAELHKALDESPSAGAAGPRNVSEEGHLVVTGWPFPNTIVWLLMILRLPRLFPKGIRRKIFLSFYLPESGSPLKVDWVWGSCLLLTRTFWEDVGGLDEDFFLFGEECDMFWRGAKKGWDCLYVPGAELVHIGGISAMTSFSVDEYQARRWSATQEVARRHMGGFHYATWALMTRWIKRRSDKSRHDEARKAKQR